VSEVIAPVTKNARPSYAPAGRVLLVPSRHANAGRIKSASRSKISTRIARAPQT